MTAPALSDRDLAILRSFSRRIDPSDAGVTQDIYAKDLDAISAEKRAEGAKRAA